MKRYSIIQEDLTQCYVCGTTQNIHIHHVFRGVNRNKSEKYHCIVALCIHHHTGSNEAVHNNKELDLHLKRLAQKHYEERYGSREDFRETFGRNYL